MKAHRIQRFGDLWLEFDGELIGTASSDDGEKPRWQVVNIYRTSRDTYVLERLGESRLDGEVTMRHVDELNNANQVRHRLERRRDDGAKYLTIVALEALDEAADVDESFRVATAERI